MKFITSFDDVLKKEDKYESSGRTCSKILSLKAIKVWSSTTWWDHMNVDESEMRN